MAGTTQTRILTTKLRQKKTLRPALRLAKLTFSQLHRSQVITEAYEVLHDHDKRKAYDQPLGMHVAQSSPEMPRV